MKKFTYFVMGILVVFLLGVCPPGSPEYLYRCLDMTGLNILNIGGFINANHIQWIGGTYLSAYYESDGIDDDLYGYFSVPIQIAGGRVVLDSLFLCMWTQDAGDYAEINIVEEECDGSSIYKAIAHMIGAGSTGWIDTQVLDSAFVTTKDRCYKYWLECINDGATDIRVRYCTRLYYHTID